MAPAHFLKGPDIAISTGFSLVVTVCLTVVLFWFIRKRQLWRALIFGGSLIAAELPHAGVYPEEVGSRLFNFSVAMMGLPAVLLTNLCLWGALNLFRKDNRFPLTLRQRLCVLGYSCGVVFLCYGNIFEELGLKETDGSITHNILTAFYFTASTWTTVGYGDVLPHDGCTRLFAALAALNGYAVLAVLIAILLPISSWKAKAKIER